MKETIFIMAGSMIFVVALGLAGIWVFTYIEKPKADLNQDGKVDMADVSILMSQMEK